MSNIKSVFRKEFSSHFTSPAAWLFLAAFLTVNLFVFFWGEAFFARNIADLKPLFQWVPVLLIFLIASLTMRSWSEERRSGTLENLLTSPISPLQLVLGKFLACLALVALALGLTLPLPITVSYMGPLDWGPVLGGYIASLFLAAAYIAIGLYVSSRTDNPIVALILATTISGLFYLLGSNIITTLFSHQVSGYLRLFGSGSRFDAITRGVFDIRDIYYYLSIVGIFLTLNLLSLERFRWAGNISRLRHKQWNLLAGLVAVNFILANFWLNGIGWARIDLTQGNIYSLSASTRQYIQQLHEPLLIRGYFSDKSHPLLEPLVPQIKDLLQEYQVAGGDQVRIEFVDPHTSQALEEEAAEKYGIRPVPFRMANRYQSGVVNSYFDLVIAYGDQYETLSYDDLIEIKSKNSGDIEVLLKNPEYAITSALRKVAHSYQAGSDIFATLQQPLTFYGYISAEHVLPETLRDLSQALKSTLDALKQSAGNQFRVEFADPDANNGELAKQLKKDYGFSQQIASLFDPRPFWFYMLLKSEDETVQVPLPAELNKETLKKSIQAAVQRMTPGYLKTVAIVTPPTPQTDPVMIQMGERPKTRKYYQKLRDTLAENVRLKETDLKAGYVPAESDLLLLLAPENLDEKQLFAIDQFLMQGGSIIIASSPFDVEISNTLSARKIDSGLQDWLKHYGLTLSDTMVLDPKNASLPIPVQRRIGPIAVNEIKMMPYPYFPDLRGNGLNDEHLMTSALRQLTLNWASPINVHAEKNQQRTVVELLHSSKDSWISDSLDVLPDYQRYPDTGFQFRSGGASQLLAVAVKGHFESSFKGKRNPLLAEKDDKDSTAGSEDEKPAKDPSRENMIVSGIIERSSDSARIILIASNTFASDNVIRLASQGQGTEYTRPLELMQNAIDWSLGDQGLMRIRSRAQFSRLLEPMEQDSRLFWEYLNYALALFGLVAVWSFRRIQMKHKQSHYEKILSEV